VPPPSGGKITLKNVTAQIAAGGSITAVVIPTHANPGLQKLVVACLDEIESGAIQEAFLERLAHYNRSKDDRGLQEKLNQAGCPDSYYDFAIEAKDSFAKFFEVMCRHKSGQLILITAFKHAYIIFREKVHPYIETMSFVQQQSIFEEEVVKFLNDNLTGLPEFDGRMEALGTIYFLADNCFIEYAKCSS
jgi:hypothetical protein